MAHDYIESYLVSIGWDLDTSGQAKVKQTLDSVEKNVAGSVNNIGKSIAKLQTLMVKSLGDSFGAAPKQSAIAGAALLDFEKRLGEGVKFVLEWQAAVVGTFAAISGAAIGLADHVADADLRLQITASRMMATVPQTRAMTDALQLLGVTWDDLMASPELMERFRTLFDDGMRLQQEFGAGFEDNLKAIRDLKFGFTELKLELLDVSRVAVSKLFEDLGLGPASIEDKIKSLNHYIEQHLPEISNALAKDVVPILKETWKVLLDIGEVGKEGFGIFQEFVGLFSGDSSLQDAPVTFDSIARSVEHVIHGIDWLLDGIIDAEKAFLDFSKAAIDFFEGNWDKSALELREGLSHLTAGAGTVVGGIVGTAGGGATGAVVGGILGSPLGPLGTAAGASLGGALGSFFGGAEGAGVGYEAGKHNPLAVADSDPTASWGGSRTSSDDISRNQQLIIETAKKLGIDPLLALAVAKTESGFRQFDSSGRVLMPNDPNSHAKGIFQLEPGTARQMGVDASDAGQNIEGGERYLRLLLQHYNGNTDLAVEAYHNGPGAVDYSLMHGTALRADAAAYDQQVGRNERQLVQTVHIEGTQIHITQPGASAAEIGHEVDRRMSQAVGDQLMVAQGPY